MPFTTGPGAGKALGPLQTSGFELADNLVSDFHHHRCIPVMLQGQGLRITVGGIFFLQLVHHGVQVHALLELPNCFLNSLPTWSILE